MKILLIGGYGSFGSRIVELLKGEPKLCLVIAGRSLGKARGLCARHGDAKAKLVPLGLDREFRVAEQLREIAPDWVIDASGPFQAYGEKCYALIEACIAAKVHYLDLADGSEFVKGVSRFDERAKRAGVFILSGVSSFPVLNAAVVRHLSLGFEEVHLIHSGIAPSPYAGVGLNVVRAVAGYAGQAVVMKRDGQVAKGYPFTESKYFVIAAPGQIPLRRLRFSLVDVPDLQMLAEEWPQAREVWVGAAPVPVVLHRVLNVLAWMVRVKVLPSLAPLAGLIDWFSNHVRWGEHRGGMFVRVQGTNEQGQPRYQEWHMLAEGEDGPLIPAMAVEALVRRALQGQFPAPGARAALREIELSDYEKLFQKRRIFTGTRGLEGEQSPTKKPLSLYQGLLAGAWPSLPEPVRALHAASHPSEFAGVCTVDRGTSVLSRLVAKIIGFPKEGMNQAIQVRFEKQLLKDGRSAEVWRRTINGQSFSSLQFKGRGRSEALINERFGPNTYSMAVIVRDQQLHLVLRAWSVLGIPLPLWLGPRAKAFESADADRFHFFVEIAHPLLGLIVRYQGTLAQTS